MPRREITPEEAAQLERELLESTDKELRETIRHMNHESFLLCEMAQTIGDQELIDLTEALDERVEAVLDHLGESSDDTLATEKESNT